METKTDRGQITATRNYMTKHYERLEFSFRKEEKWKERIDEHCREYGYMADSIKGGISRVNFLKKAMETQMAIDRGELKLTKPRKKKEEK